MSEPSPAAPAVHAPPLASLDLPGTGGAIGPDVEHFCVDEVPAYAPSGEGEHLYVRAEKRGLTTPELVRRLADAAEVETRDIGYAGLKDKHAVTSQWLSLPRHAKEPATWALPDGVRVLEASRHGNKLRTGHLVGNRFRITLVGVVPDALALGQAVAERLTASGLPNYFGLQRFGRDAENLGRALAWLRGGARQRLSAFLVKLYPSVVQSEIFNRYVTARRELGLDRLFPGEVVRLEGSGASFVVEDEARETARLLSRDIHLTGPMLGPKMRPASGRARELELEAASAAGVDAAVLEVLARFAPGTRRDLLVYPESLALTQPGPETLVLDFVLPAGSYATVLVREFTRGDSARPEAD